MVLIKNKNTVRFAVLALASLFALGACTTTPPAKTVSWQQHEAAVSGLENWSLQGRIAVNDQSQGWHATVRWQQNNADYSIELIGPFGQGRIRIDGSPGGVVLQSAEGVVNADNAETLLEQATGIRVPVSGLRYWVLGVPAPDRKIQTTTGNGHGQIASLRQDGWLISYPRYSSDAGGLQLPKLINATQHDIKVKLVIDAWQLQG